MSQVITALGLEGHDSELFSFLEADRVDELRAHPSAETVLWTFGSVGTVDIDGTASHPTLQTATYWNSRPSCLAFTEQPDVVVNNDKFIRYRGFSTNDQLIQVQALVLLRYLFVQGYTCALDDRPWIQRPADPSLQRLRFIRNWEPAGCGTRWECMKRDFYWWVFNALDRVPTALGVVRMDRMDTMVDRCLDTNQRAG